MARIPCLTAVIGLLLAGLALPASATVSAKDDTGHMVTLPAPARRIVSLAPHITETLFAIGAGDRLVGAVQYSDYPEAAKKIPRVGSYAQLDLEAIAALRPDLVVAWKSGNPPGQVEKLKRLGLTVFLTEARRLEDVPSDMERLAILTGTASRANRIAADFRRRHAALRQAYQRRRPVRVFYEVWNNPLITVSGQHFIGDAMTLCGAVNVFAAASAPTPTVDREAVVAADPEAIVASGMGESRPEWLDDWRRWPGLKAVKEGNLFFVPPDLLHRPGPRVIEGAERLCGVVEEARRKR